MDSKPKSFALLIAAMVVIVLIIFAFIYKGEKPNLPLTSPQQAAQNATSPLENVKPVTAADHIQGNLNAPIALVEFSDLECSFCKVFHQTLEQVLPTYEKAGQLAWVYRHFPLDSLHSKARKEAEATECATELGGPEMFWKYTTKIFSVTPSNDGLDPAQLPIIAKGLGIDQKQFEACLASGKYADKVAANQAEAIATGGQGTPHTIIILQDKKDLDLKQFSSFIDVSADGSKIALKGALPKEVIDSLLKEIIRQTAGK